MTLQKNRFVRWKICLVLAGVVLLILVLCFTPDEPARYVIESSHHVGPVECRLVINSWASRLALAYQDLPAGRLREGRVPPLKNPLVMGHLLAHVEVRNCSGDELAIFSRIGESDTAELMDAFGEVMEAVEDESGKPLEWNSVTSSLKRLGSVDEHTGKWVWDDTRTAPQRPVLRLAAGQVLRYKFCPPVSADRPSTYTARAIFRYHEAPSGKECFVRSNAIAVRVTQADLDEWDRNVGIWVWGL